jgi:hypothetical protein
MKYLVYDGEHDGGTQNYYHVQQHAFIYTIMLFTVSQEAV